MSKRLFGPLYLQVLIAVAAGIAVGALAPRLGGELKPLADGFIKLIKMLFAPIIFTTVVLGIARLESLKDLGRVGLRALIYFEVLSTFALLVGLVVVNVLGPGRGMHVDPAKLDSRSLQSYTAAPRHDSFADFVLSMIPTSVVDALARNEVLQVLLFSVLLGVALTRLRERADPLVGVLEVLREALFGIVGMVMRLAPLAAFGAMAFTVGTYGFGSLRALGKLVFGMYATCALFVIVVLGAIARVSGFSLWKLLRYLKDELALVLGTASSESVVPQVMWKLEDLGCSKPVVGLIVPSMRNTMLERIVDGRTDLVFEYVAAGHPATSADAKGVSLVKWCAYYGDASAIRFLLANGESLGSLGDDLGLNAAAFHGHWRLCQFLIEGGADVNRPCADTGETPLHAALCKANRPASTLVLKVLLANRANPNSATKTSAETGAFMRDARTKGETPLHRAAAFGTEEAIQLLIDAGARLDAKDMNGESPLGWASRHLRPDSILRKLCYGDFAIHPQRQSMEASLLGTPHV